MEEKRKIALKIMEALSGVDEELLECSSREKRISAVRRLNRFGRLAAACLCVIVAGVASYGALSLRNGDKSTGSQQHMEDIAEPLSGEDVEGAAGAAEGAAENLEEATPEAEKVPEQTLVADNADSGIINELAEEKASGDTAWQEGVMAKQELLDKDSGSLNGSRKITREEAYASEPCGKYLPLSLPEGYVYENGNLQEESRAIYVTWTKGMDYISIRVSRLEESQVAFADITRPELYDVNLYEIPYGDTVPEEYRETFDQPVFRREDLTLELVQMRMKVISDSGDTGMPRGNFSVFYEDGILVEFNGRGTPQSIYDMFLTIAE